MGGDLSPERLLMAYRSGIFPWFNDDALILWWSPDPRMVLFPRELRVSKSMRKVLRDGNFTMTYNTQFEKIIDACASADRKGQEGTWITAAMKRAYLELHESGHAVSYETWCDGELVGGLYGIDLGGIFCGESMFSSVSNASKFAFISAVQSLQTRGCKVVDCQMYTRHLEMLGAREIPRAEFAHILRTGIT